MIRSHASSPQRLASTLSAFLTVVLALILIWYGAMLALLAVKVSPHAINAISGYHSLYNDIVGVRHGDFTTGVRLVAGISGLVAFILLTMLAGQRLIGRRGHRRDVTLEHGDRGTTTVQPRAIERLAEIAACLSDEVSSASGRLARETLDVQITTLRANTAPQALREAHDQIVSALACHELPVHTTNVTVTDYEPTNKRQLK